LEPRAGSGGSSGKDYHQVDFSTGAVYLSIAFPGCFGPCNAFHHAVIQDDESLGRRSSMNSTTIIRIVAGVLVVVILVVLIQRRRTRTK
jgi:hypothetical protein